MRDNRSFSGGASPSPTAIFSLFTFHSSLFTLHSSLLSPLPVGLKYTKICLFSGCRGRHPLRGTHNFVASQGVEDVIPYVGHIISLLLGAPGTSPPTRFVFSQTTFLADRVLVGLAAARSRCGSNTTLWCFSLPPRRFATFPLARAKARFYLASTVYPCSNNSPFDIFVREFFGRGAGEPLFAKKVPPHSSIKLS